MYMYIYIYIYKYTLDYLCTDYPVGEFSGLIPGSQKKFFKDKYFHAYHVRKIDVNVN